MINKYFDEPIVENDLFFICFLIEKVSRHIHQRNAYVVNKLGYDNLYHLTSVANVLHCENSDQVICDVIEEYGLEEGDFHIENVNRELCTNIPTEFDMGKVYTRLIVDTLYPDEDYIEGILRIYNDEICRILDDYNNGSYYEPSYVIARAYKNGEF
ncbi:hypothetical protein [uncultured Holdemanella sp.]|uniref:hypothetical protein n=1 Tax=uncultured Holdemanella sp. TaxID=1763549 RepID=UPI0025E13689|nr:hypothetical protein [uncultured Holdemanella sp.]